MKKLFSAMLLLAFTFIANAQVTQVIVGHGNYFTLNSKNYPKVYAPFYSGSTTIGLRSAYYSTGNTSTEHILVGTLAPTKYSVDGVVYSTVDSLARYLITACSPSNAADASTYASATIGDVDPITTDVTTDTVTITMTNTIKVKVENLDTNRTSSFIYDGVSYTLGCSKSSTYRSSYEFISEFDRAKQMYTKLGTLKVLGASGRVRVVQTQKQ